MLANINDSLESLQREIDELEQQRKVLIYDRIKNCRHEYLYNQKGSSSPYGNDPLICKHCRVQVEAGYVGRINTPIFNTTKSELVTPNTYINSLYRIQDIMLDAIKYPMRFSQETLADIFDDSPWTVEDVIASDKQMVGRYSVTKIYHSTKEWYDDQFN